MLAQLTLPLTPPAAMYLRVLLPRSKALRGETDRGAGGLGIVASEVAGFGIAWGMGMLQNA